jgi:hypothetical protein
MSESGYPGFEDFQDGVIFGYERFSDTSDKLPLTHFSLTIYKNSDHYL